jgi:hypothetical protein
MKFPVETFLAGIAERKLYYFSNKKLNTEIEHHYICIKKTDNDVLILSCCTSQFDTIRNFVESRNLPNSTLVWISPVDGDNMLTKDTYVDCNNVHLSSIEEFKTMYDADSITFTGEISESHYVQILIGLHDSPLIDNATKKLIPKAEK